MSSAALSRSWNPSKSTGASCTCTTSPVHRPAVTCAEPLSAATTVQSPMQPERVPDVTSRVLQPRRGGHIYQELRSAVGPVRRGSDAGERGARAVWRTHATAVCRVPPEGQHQTRPSPCRRSTLTSQDNVTWGDPMENVTRVEFVHYDPWRGFIVRGLTGRFACQALSDHLQPQYLFFRLEVEGQHESATAGDKPESTARKSLTTVYIAAITCFIVLFLVVVTIIVGCKMLKRKKYDHEEVEKFLSQSQGDYNPELPIDEQTGCVPYDPKWEFPEERLRMGMILGQGAFGRVVKAEAVGIGGSNDVITVAVKVVKDCTNKEQMMALVSELKILIHIGHHLNIVNLLGAVTKDLRYGKLSIIVEYCPFGCLQNYLLKNKNSLRDIPDIKLIKNKPKPQETKRYGPVSRGSPRANYVNQGMEPAGPPLTITNLLCWAFQVCRGMEYLASRRTNHCDLLLSQYVHRDLAARNVLLTANNVVKICDFGLARDVYRNAKYYKKREGPVPIKWMALESLTHGLYTTKSDV
ncbi:hypothetical protein C0Q70_06237 [Pomacea canaliculata]|uniref:Protein kinase domain-containing protein n=1 Tax=Pomacea canaliculata TaxID=400727 RepID=A0A2T7PNE7_POMCA|nr:hypothetical protein C0Q70_06237 [Pomacea canaliculata]